MNQADATGARARARVARILACVLRDRLTLREALARHPGPTRDEAFVRELAWGTCRHYFTLDAAVRQHLRQPPRQRDLDVHALLLCGLYQLRHMQVPPHAALHATVEATVVLKKKWAGGLVNAVLRKLSQADQTALATVPGLPDWWLRQLQQDWPEHWQAIVAAGDSRPPMTLRTARKPQLERSLLAEAGISARSGTLHAAALYLDEPRDVHAIPGFDSGHVSVQDEGAQLAVPLLEAAAGERILDACAAPGGKTLQLLQTCPGVEVMALDVDAGRCQHIRENLTRASVQATVVAGDGRHPRSWWDGQPFDRILLDAPCSASGILRRQPDIRLLRQQDDLAALQTLQAALLDALWPLLRPGGILLYSTCSVFRQENVAVIDAFLDRQTDGAAEPLPVDWGLVAGAGRQLLPTTDEHDGFYFARLRRQKH